MATDEPRGIRAYDLHVPSKPLVVPYRPLSMPLSSWPSAAEQIAARRAEGERRGRIEQAAEEAMAEWQAFADSLAGNPVALAALECHQPTVEYFNVGCSECRESDCDDTVPVEWPCGTYMAMKAAA